MNRSTLYLWSEYAVPKVTVRNQGTPYSDMLLFGCLSCHS